MARFYRTSNSTPIDYMRRLNIPLMEKVLQSNELAIDNSLATNAQLKSLANFNYIDKDAEEAAKVQEEINNRANEFAKNMLADPANWRKQMQPLREFQENLVDNYRNGAISKYVGNYNKRKQDFDAVDKQVELYHTSGGEKGVDPTRAAAYKMNWDKNFAGTKYNPDGPIKYNAYRGGQVMDNIDIKKKLAEGLDKIKADKRLIYHSNPYGNDWYFNTETNMREEVTPEKILAAAGGNVSEQIGRYLASDKSVGLIGENVDIDYRNAYGYANIPIQDNEQKYIDTFKNKIASTKNEATKKLLQGQLDEFNKAIQNRKALRFNPNNYFSPILSGLVNQFGYRNIEEGNKLTNNAKGAAEFNQANQNMRHRQTLQQTMAIHNDTQKNLNDRFRETMDLNKLKFEEDKWQFRNPQAKPGTTKSTTAKTTAEKKSEFDSRLPDVAGVSELATRSFEDMTVHDPKSNSQVPLLSVPGLSVRIGTLRDEQRAIETKLKETDDILASKPKAWDIVGQQRYAKALGDKRDLELGLSKVRGDLSDTRTWYKATTEKALKDVDAQTANLYRQFEKDGGQSLRDELAKAQKEAQTAQANTYYQNRHPRKPNETEQQYSNRLLSEQQNANKDSFKRGEAARAKVQEAAAKVLEFDKAKKRVDQAREGVLSTVRKTVVDSDAIIPSKQDSKVLTDMLLNNSQSLVMYDETGKNTAGIEVEGKGISWFNPKGDNFNLTFAGDKLKDYMTTNGVEMQVEQVAPTTKIGRGNAVAKVTFHDPTGGIPEGKVFYVEMDDKLQKQVATKFKGHGDKRVSRIAETMDDAEANSIRNQVARPNFSTVTGNQADDGHFTLNLPIRGGNIYRVEAVKMGGNRLYIVGTDPKTGEKIPFPSTNAQPGMFESVDDFIQQFKDYKAKAKI